MAVAERSSSQQAWLKVYTRILTEHHIALWIFLPQHLHTEDTNRKKTTSKAGIPSTATPSRFSILIKPNLVHLLEQLRHDYHPHYRYHYCNRRLRQQLWQQEERASHEEVRGERHGGGGQDRSYDLNTSWFNTKPVRPAFSWSQSLYY